jgi:hypothetical protein
MLRAIFRDVKRVVPDLVILTGFGLLFFGVFWGAAGHWLGLVPVGLGLAVISFSWGAAK